MDGTLTINKARATVTANSDTSKVYTGQEQGVSGFTATGLVNGETESVLSGVTAGASGTNAGSYTAKAAVGSYSGNYDLSFANGNLTISKAPLTYTADSTLRVTGQSLDSLTGSVSGFLGPDSQASATQGSIIWTTPASSRSKAGRYAIYGAGLSAVNYTFAQAIPNQSALTLIDDVTLTPDVISRPSMPPVADVQATESWVRNMGPNRGSTVARTNAVQTVLVQCAGVHVPPCIPQAGWLADFTLDSLPIVLSIVVPKGNSDEVVTQNEP